MESFEAKEIQIGIDAMIEQIKLNLDTFEGVKDFPYERDGNRINNPRFNLIRKFHVPTNYSIESEFMPDVAGRAKWVGKRIIINDELTSVESIKVLIHEWAHMRMHLKNNAVELEHAIKEVEAESVAFVVMALLGLTDDGEKTWNINDSLKYLISYIKQSEKSVDEIYKLSKKRIETTVNHILNKYLIGAY